MKTLYTNAELKLTNEAKIDPIIIEARFKSFNKLHSTLSKRRQRVKALSNQSNDLADLNVTDSFKDMAHNQLDLLDDNNLQCTL